MLNYFHLQVDWYTKWIIIHHIHTYIIDKVICNEIIQITFSQLIQFVLDKKNFCTPEFSVTYFIDFFLRRRRIILIFCSFMNSNLNWLVQEVPFVISKFAILIEIDKGQLPVPTVVYK